jgi:hypothetical protein
VAPPSSASDSDLPLDDLVRRSAIGHRFPGERLPAGWAVQISVGVALDDLLLEALNQSPRAALAVLVQELAAVGAVDPDRPCTSSRSHLQ